ncbi:MAG: hypothetical protein H7A53_02575 [Akkermansiaceae bacterium]|nr:hypothetical protein [Akkermansiaceae bacterium]MCP5549770.1 hypothetical protein [Akkermansiaceae bacterium]
MADQISLLEKALAASPGNWKVRRSLAAQYMAKERTEDAAHLILEAPSIPDEEDEQVFAASLLAEIDPAAAHGFLDEFLEHHAASPQAHLLKARLFLKAGERQKARTHLEVAATLDPKISVEDELGPEEAPAAAAVVEVVEAAPAVTVAAPAEPEPAPVAVVPAPVPLTPRPLAPPPSEETKAPAPAPAAEKAVTPVEIPPATAAPTPVPLHVEPAAKTAGEAESEVHMTADGEIDAEYYDEHHEGTGERSFIVGEGEMVHAHDKEPDAKEKVSALAMAIFVHAAIFFALSWWVISQPRKDPPAISVSSMASTDEDSMENQTVTKMQQKTAQAVTSAQPVVSVESFSAVALPEVTDVSQDLTMVTLNDGTAGFGMSMSGFGDVSNMGAIPAAMQSRCSMSQRMQRLRESGGEDRAEKAVRNALEFLAAQQNKDTGAIGVEFPCAATGLSLLAFLGHCETPESPKFGDAVVNAALYLMEVSRKNDGMIWNGQKGNHQSYEHAIGTYALSELHTMTKESGRTVPKLESTLKRAVGIIVDGQAGGGGWAYGYGKNNDAQDMSVVGWQIQALKAAYNTGEKFSGLDKTLDKAMQYMKDIQDKDGAFKYRPKDPKGKPTLTGAALLGMQIWNQMDTAEYKKGLGFLTNAYKNPTPGNNFYAPYYNTQVFFLHGGKEWEDYNTKFQAKLLDAQNPDGSWTKPGAGGHGGKDAHLLNTAWGCLMLEVYYRYLPTTDKVEGLKKH